LREAQSPHRATAREPFSPAVLERLYAWIWMGAPDPRSSKASLSTLKAGSRQHWAFQPVAHPAIPVVQNSAWVKQPIDHFVLDQVERSQVQLPSLAERSELIRRVSFDLTGLPPTLAELDAFLKDPSPDAFTAVVDRLVDSAQFGEHWGRLWLRLAGYADGELAPAGSTMIDNAWHYRDYVVAAFNKDKPFDQFVREQLAGDLFPADSETIHRERLMATGFLLLGNSPALEPRRPELLLDVADDQVERTCRVFLGLSVACARCHDHKTDPITRRDYYALAGIFTSTASLSQSSDRWRRGIPRWRERSLATPDEMAELTTFETRLKQLRQQLNEARQIHLEFPGGVDSGRLTGVVVDNLAADVQGVWKESNYSTNFVDRNYLHDGNADKGKKSARFVPDLPTAGQYEVMVSYTPRANRATNVPVTITAKDGSKKVFVNQTLAPSIDKVFSSVGRFNFAAGTNGSVLISNEGTKGFVVVDAVRFVPVEAGAASGPGPFDGPDPEAALLNYHQLEKELLEFSSKRPVLPAALAADEGKIHDCRVGLNPGNPKTETVSRGFPSLFGAPASTAYVITDEDSGRLQLANWLANSQNPLTARVAVNRVWQHLFGVGLVATPDDFGLAGAAPSNPALLDYLASQFMAEGWSLKKLIRSLVLSRSYQSAWPEVGTPTALAHDLVVRPHQLEPEVIRDAMLAVTGELDRSIGGDWMPEDLAMDPVQAAERVPFISHRRSLYLPTIQGVPADVWKMFRPLESAGDERSRVAAAKARFFLERTRTWAEALLAQPTSNETQRVTVAYRQAFSRTPTPDETRRALQILLPASGPSTAPPSARGRPTLTAVESFCDALLTSSEFSK
jgi:hypothetical protein